MAVANIGVAARQIRGKTAMSTEAWHFVGDTLRDGNAVPPDGQALVRDDEATLCVSGLHASERILDALKYAPGNTICRVTCDDVVGRQDDKLVCRSRTVEWRLDGEQVLRDFARRVALDVADLWDMPDVVRGFLETGNENQRIAARAAARDASRAAVARGDVAAAGAGEAARAAAARTHEARATGLAAAWAATKASGDESRWEQYSVMLEAMVEEARQAGDDDDEWSDFGDDFDLETA